MRDELRGLTYLAGYLEGRRDLADKLDELVQLHEKTYGTGGMPHEPQSEAWQCAKQLLDGITCISDNVPERKEDCEDKW